MIEHDPWIGPLYATEGILGQRIGIVGYSAWTPDDHRGYTIESVENVISGAWPNVRFFNDIASYFGLDRADFYRRVVMFEFVPCAIGGGENRYGRATPEQEVVGRDRLLRIARDHAVEKLLVFSRKAWGAMPVAEDTSVERVFLPDTRFEVRRYQVDDHSFAAIGLRHPQYAPRLRMEAAVEQIMALAHS